MNSLHATPTSPTSQNTNSRAMTHALSPRKTTLSKSIVLRISLLLCLLSNNTAIYASRYKPRLTVLIVIDQLAYDAIQKHHNYFKYGFRTLITKGVNYTNAYHPHGTPATATGHAALSTGTYAKDHGIVNNSWFDVNNNLINASDGTKESAAVFSPTGTYDYGISSENLMTSTISDQFSLQSTDCSQCYVYALSAKSHAATQMAGKQGKAIWFDEKTGNFTSSKAYFDSLPAWLTCFNTRQTLNNLNHITWCQAKPCTSNGYRYTRKHITPEEKLVSTQIPIEWDSRPQDPFHLFLQTPHANQLVLNLAKTCIDTHINKKNNHQLMLWISLGSLDKVGHIFGPDSKEYIDTLYHLDKQLERFMRYARRVIGPRETLFVLTSDHGICPITEVMRTTKIPAGRYSSREIVSKLNKYIDSIHAQTALIKTYATPQFYVDTKQFNKLDAQKQIQILNDAKNFLHKEPGIKRVWTYQELENMICEPDTFESYYKNQLYPGRSGQLIVQTMPYYEITDWKTGADHHSPYNYNTHVPLILYQKGAIELKTVGERVFTLQLANTLADILHIPKPPASVAERLPKIDPEINDYLF